MANPPNVRRIRTEDFDPEYRPLIERISYAFNEFADQVIFNLTGGIDFNNINQKLVDVTIKIDSTGAIINAPKINATDLKTKVVGVIPVNATN